MSYFVLLLYLNVIDDDWPWDYDTPAGTDNPKFTVEGILFLSPILPVLLSLSPIVIFNSNYWFLCLLLQSDCNA